MAKQRVPKSSTVARAASSGQRVGYTRVSSADQNESRQLDGLALERVFSEAASGKDTNRPKLQDAIQYLREGDTLVVHSMDRLARSLADLERLVDDLNSRGVAVEFIKERLTFTGDDDPFSVLMRQVIGSVSQFERSMIRERQREGIALAKERGVYKGRTRSLAGEQIASLRARAAAGESKAQLAREHGISRETVYQYLKTI